MEVHERREDNIYTSIHTVFYLLLIDFIHFMHLIIYLRILMHEL
jgi:hypothetical protein